MILLPPSRAGRPRAPGGDITRLPRTQQGRHPERPRDTEQVAAEDVGHEVHPQPEPGEAGQRDDHPRPDPPGPSRPATGDGPDGDEADDGGDHRAQRMPGGEAEPGGVRHRIGERRPGPPDQVLEPRRQQAPGADRDQGEHRQSAGTRRIGSTYTTAAGTPPQRAGADGRENPEHRRVEHLAHPAQRGHQPTRGGRQPAERLRDVGVVLHHRRPAGVDHDREYHKRQGGGLRAPANSAGSRWHRRIPAQLRPAYPVQRPALEPRELGVPQATRASPGVWDAPACAVRAIACHSGPTRRTRPAGRVLQRTVGSARREPAYRPPARASDSPGHLARLARSEGRPLDIAEGKPGSEDPAQGLAAREVRP